jgi:hypothetical protein
MNVGDIRRRANNMLGDDAMVVFEALDMVDMINDAIVDICRKTGVITAIMALPTTASKEMYDVPTDAIEIKRITYKGTRLIRTTWQELDMIDPSRQPATGNPGTLGEPTKFYVDGNFFGLYPIPSVSTAPGLQIWYTQIPALVVNDTDIPGIPIAVHEDIVTRVIARGHELVEDYQAAQSKAAEYNQSITLTQQQLMDSTEETYPYIRDTEGPWSV